MSSRVGQGTCWAPEAFALDVGYRGRHQPPEDPPGAVTGHLRPASLPRSVSRAGGRAQRHGARAGTSRADSEMTCSRGDLRQPPPGSAPKAGGCRAPPLPGPRPAARAPGEPGGLRAVRARPAAGAARGGGAHGPREAMAEDAPPRLELPSGLLELCALLGASRDSLRGPEQVRAPRGH